jgi:hypothetical protein
MLKYHQLRIPNVKFSLLDMRQCFVEYGEMTDVGYNVDMDPYGSSHMCQVPH